MERALVAYPAIARGTVELFQARFDPALGDGRRERAGRCVEQTIAEALESVATLDEDRILRRFLNAVRCSLRTNYWQRQGVDLLQGRQPRDRRAAGAAAAGRDLRLQPAHGGHPSARRPGGARRHPLVRPARGFPHRDPRPDEGADGEERGDRAGRLQGRLLCEAAAGQRHARAGPGRGHRLLPDPDPRPARHHRQLSSRGEVVPPADVVRHDGDDPYLVVAADKGTATFSDIANALARDYGFWLDDAFASGGSAGYDHKKMGITARGAWESVKRHFRELGHRHPDARRSPRSASATCRATCSATACCCRRRPSCWRPSTIATSSSIPLPIRRASLGRAQAAVRPAALVLDGLRQEPDLGGRRRLRPRAPSRSRSRPRRARRSASSSRRRRRST